MLLDALSAAADEITRELAPGSVELRLRGGEPEFVVTPAPADEPAEPEPTRRPPRSPDADEAATARINLRLPEQLKAGVEQAAGRERLSVNAWLVRAAAAARRAATIAARAARRPHRPDLHRLGALSARPSRTPSEPDRRRTSPCRPSTPPNRSRPRSTSASATSGSRAGDRAATVVDVRPSDPSNEDDVKAAEQTRVEYARRAAAGQGAEAALVAAPQRRRVDRRHDRAARRLARARRAARRPTSTATAGSATCRIKTGLGRIRLDEAGALQPEERRRRHHRRPRRPATPRSPPAPATCASRELDGSAVIKNSNGDTWVGDGRAATCGSARPTAASPSTSRSAGVGAKSANGDVRLGEVVRGSVVLETELGDARGRHPRGHRRLARRQRHAPARVRNALDAADAPEPSAETRRGARPHVRRRHRRSGGHDTAPRSP